MAVSPLKRLYWRACEVGVMRALRMSALDGWDWYHERRLGLDTAGEVTSDELGYDNADYQRYMPCSYWEFTRAMNCAKPTRDDVFLDIGSGKGRAVIIALHFLRKCS